MDHVYHELNNGLLPGTIQNHIGMPDADQYRGWRKNNDRINNYNDDDDDDDDDDAVDAEIVVGEENN